MKVGNKILVIIRESKNNVYIFKRSSNYGNIQIIELTTNQSAKIHNTPKDKTYMFTLAILYFRITGNQETLLNL